MISGKRHWRFIIGFLLLLPISPWADASLTFPDDIITAEKLQYLLWRDFQIEFPSIFTKRNYRVLETGTVVFQDSEQRPEFLLIANQEISSRPDGSAVRSIRLCMRAVDGRAIFDIAITDIGDRLERIAMEKLIAGGLPLALPEPGKWEKRILVSGEGINQIKLTCVSSPDVAESHVLTYDIVSKDNPVAHIREIHRTDSREVSWFLDNSKQRNGNPRTYRMLTVARSRSEGMRFGRQTYRLDEREVAAETYQRFFAESGPQALIVYLQERLVEAVRSIGCFPKCKKSNKKSE
jgi:hypothetical protein